MGEDSIFVPNLYNIILWNYGNKFKVFGYYLRYFSSSNL